MTTFEIIYIATPLVVAALGWIAVLLNEWNMRREDRAHEAMAHEALAHEAPQRSSPPAP